MTLDEQIGAINQLSREIDQTYHNIAQHFNLSDNIFWIFYIIYSSEEEITQSDLSQKWSYSKQTVNSSTSTMVKRGWVTLDLLPDSRKSKAIHLTEAGRELCEKAIGTTRQIEQHAYSHLSSEKLDQFIDLFKVMNTHFDEEQQRMLGANK